MLICGIVCVTVVVLSVPRLRGESETELPYVPLHPYLELVYLLDDMTNEVNINKLKD